MWTFLLSELWPWLLGIAGLLGGIVVAYIKGRGDERSKAAKQTVEAVKTRKGVDDEVAKMDDGELGSAYNRWVRDKRR